MSETTVSSSYRRSTRSSIRSYIIVHRVVYVRQTAAGTGVYIMYVYYFLPCDDYYHLPGRNCLRQCRREPRYNFHRTREYNRYMHNNGNKYKIGFPHHGASKQTLTKCCTETVFVYYNSCRFPSEVNS